jgi:hypothetical protein
MAGSQSLSRRASSKVGWAIGSLLIVVVGVVYPAPVEGTYRAGGRGVDVWRMARQASRATRKPMFPVELSGVLKLRAATR